MSSCMHTHLISFVCLHCTTYSLPLCLSLSLVLALLDQLACASGHTKSTSQEIEEEGWLKFLYEGTVCIRGTRTPCVHGGGGGVVRYGLPNSTLTLRLAMGMGCSWN